MLLKKKVSLKYENTRIDRTTFDIVSCALRNDFRGVDAALKIDPNTIRAKWIDNGINALMATSGRGLEGMVEHLLAKDVVDLEQLDDFGRSVLDHAKAFPRIMQQLIAVKYPGRTWSEPSIYPL